jgi:hypothetical protein
MLALVNVLGRLPKWRMPYSTRAQSTRAALAFFMSAAAGVWAWYGPGHFSLLVALLPVLLWACSATRWMAGAIMGAYMAAAGWPVPEAVAVFNGWPLPLTVVLYGAYSTLYGAFWALLWHRSILRQALGLALAFALLTVPPLGALYFASPVIAAGVLFPGLGVLGMVATWALVCTALICVHVIARAREITPAGASSVGLCYLLTLMATHQNTQINTQIEREIPIRDIHTHFGEYPADPSERYQRHFELMALVDSEMDVPSNAKVLLLPEGVAGLREPRVSWMWQEAGERAKAHGLTVAVGNSVVLEVAHGQASALVNQVELFGEQSAQLRALVDVPVGSWKPWAASGHYPARWFEEPDQTEIDGVRIGAVMCWEELVAWPWLRHAGVGTTTLLAASNTWFDGGYIDAAQRRSSWALGRLFGINVVRAANTARDR